MRRCRRVLAAFAASFCLAAAAPAQEPEESTSAAPLARVLPAVASTEGAEDSFFRTSLQIVNPLGAPLTGRLVFHPAGVPGSVIDPGLDFTIPALETISYSDVLEAMGQEGLGTLDILLPTASSSPVIVARVFNDAGAFGTSGFTEEAISPSETGVGGRVILGGSSGFLVLPSDLVNYRFNIGVRTLSSGVSLQFTIRDADGDFVAVVAKSLSASSFVQQEANAFLGVALPEDGSVRVNVSGGSAIVYGATVDNTTNDPSIQFARTIP